ncbi:hypothetical protein NtRootA9_23080 [Arthrobacter sp. NtRootA9]|nr:hypothetical protein NtRootA9_23080 [Arthrobacter sp. NtRootA9]
MPGALCPVRCLGGLIGGVSHWFLAPVPCMAPRSRAGVMIIANTISTLVKTCGGGPQGALRLHAGRGIHAPELGFVVTKRLPLELNPR